MVQTNNGSSNTLIGRWSGERLVSGSSNTFLGKGSGQNLLTGSQNVMIGLDAGFGSFLGSNASGNNNIYLGTKSGFNNINGSNNIFVGYESGYNELGSDKLYIENSNSANPLIWGDFSTYDVRINGNLCYTGTIGTCSDIHFKKNIVPISNALDRLKQINGIKHQWRHGEFPDMVWKEGEEYGVIAQEVKNVFPELVNTDKDGYLYVDYAKLTPILIEAIKEQQNKIEKLERKVATIEKLSARMESLESALARSKEMASN